MCQDWKQELIPFSQFLERIQSNGSSASVPTYLAQHQLFDQVCIHLIKYYSRELVHLKFSMVKLNSSVIYSNGRLTNYGMTFVFLTIVLLVVGSWGLLMLGLVQPELWRPCIMIHTIIYLLRYLCIVHYLNVHLLLGGCG